jgi:hypothetical protein
MHIEHDYGLGGFASTANLLRFLRYVTDVLDHLIKSLADSATFLPSVRQT